LVEISWGKALGYGGRFIAYIILWAILGTIIVIAGGAVLAGSLNITYDSATQQWQSTDLNWGGLIAGVIIIVVGEIIVILGAIASYFKLMSKLMNETSPTTQPRPPPP
jgi:hypothetical protein